MIRRLAGRPWSRSCRTLRAHPLEERRRRAHRVCAARRVEHVERVLRAAQLEVRTGARDFSRSARTNSRASSTNTSVSCVPCTTRNGGAFAHARDRAHRVPELRILLGRALEDAASRGTGSSTASRGSACGRGSRRRRRTAPPRRRSCRRARSRAGSADRSARARSSAVRWPPAEPPVTHTKPGSAPYSATCARIQRDRALHVDDVVREASPCGESR